MYKKGSKFEPSASLDGGGYALAAETLGLEQVGDGVIFKLGPANAPDAVTSRMIQLPAGKYTSVRLLATAVEGNQTEQSFNVSYADGTSSSFNQSLSDWAGSARFRGESAAVDVPYRIDGNGSVDGNSFRLWTYRLPLDPSKEARSITLPSNHNVLVFAITLVPSTSPASTE
jgi:hypothetical protein